MNLKDARVCADFLAQMAANFAAMPTAKGKALQAAVDCQIAQTYVEELARHLEAGMEPFDAMEAITLTVEELPGAAVMALEALAAKRRT